MSKASSHFIKDGFDEKKKKNMMKCKHCHKRLINSGNTNCYGSHLSRCRPDLYAETTTNIQAFNKKRPAEVLFSSQSCSQQSLPENGSPVRSDSTTPFKVSTPVPIKTFLLSKTPYSADSAERLRLIDSVVNCVVKLNLPLSIVDEEPFIKLLADCNNRFKIPCRQTLTKKLIPAKALKAKEQLKADLNLIKYCSLTCDGWTSEGSDSYLGCNRFKFI